MNTWTQELKRFLEHAEELSMFAAKMTQCPFVFADEEQDLIDIIVAVRALVSSISPRVTAMEAQTQDPQMAEIRRTVRKWAILADEAVAKGNLIAASRAMKDGRREISLAIQEREGERD